MKITVLLLALTLNISACNPEEGLPTPPVEKPDKTERPDKPGIPDQTDPPQNNTLRIIINSTSYTVTLTNNASAKAFQAMLPMSINMGEMNGNEKYYYLPDNLPMSATIPGTIQNGDIMLFGSNCLVLFYKTFSTPYSYTRIGRVDNPSGLEPALGPGIASVKFDFLKNE